MFSSRYVVSPNRGSLRLDSTTTPSSGENQRSLTMSIGAWLPIAPAGIVRVVRVPCASTPSRVAVPSDSVRPSPGARSAIIVSMWGPAAGMRTSARSAAANGLPAGNGARIATLRTASSE
jgi:hypothetical protein